MEKQFTNLYGRCRQNKSVARDNFISINTDMAGVASHNTTCKEDVALIPAVPNPFVKTCRTVVGRNLGTTGRRFKKAYNGDMSKTEEYELRHRP
jgi:hypothetical protein